MAQILFQLTDSVLNSELIQHNAKKIIQLGDTLDAKGALMYHQFFAPSCTKSDKLITWCCLMDKEDGSIPEVIGLAILSDSGFGFSLDHFVFDADVDVKIMEKFYLHIEQVIFNIQNKVNPNFKKTILVESTLRYGPIFVFNGFKILSQQTKNHLTTHLLIKTISTNMEPYIFIELIPAETMKYLKDKLVSLWNNFGNGEKIFEKHGAKSNEARHLLGLFTKKFKNGVIQVNLIGTMLITDKSFLLISSFVVDEEYRKKGFGIRFYQMAEELYIRKIAKINDNYRTLMLATRPENAGFYEKLGYKTVAEINSEVSKNIMLKEI